MTVEEMKKTAERETRRIEELNWEITKIYEHLHTMCREECDNVPHSNEEIKDLEENGTKKELNRAYDENAEWFKGFDALKEAEEYAHENMR